ncbi:unnamed protein product [Hydatigera taeniaeformis]|uniref:HECT-type E3 ubiquitin transferase n=1 Tax=Hydatigena taeniaeformis TaxID=6205 RepID=A0A0R3X001_HYDTA|nr:unnamed protein product [Hydatigera taeniaeformis]
MAGAFLVAYYSIISESSINISNARDLDLLISGLSNIDIDDPRTITTYSKCQSTSPWMERFWQALKFYSTKRVSNFCNS